MQLKQRVFAVAGAALAVAGFGAMHADAATTTVVRPSNTQGWSTADTRPGGAVNFVADATAPAGAGALQLTTDATNAAKAQYLHAANTPIADVTDLSYYTKQNAASFPQGDPSYQLLVNLNGTSGFTTFVYEPYEQAGPAVVNGAWQQWDVDQGQFWSSRTVTCDATSTTFTAGAGGAPFYTLAQIKAACPNAVAVGFGVNVGSYNPSYDVETDLVQFNTDVYDFEPNLPTPTNKDQCKNNGWQSVSDNGTPFKNQGDCVSFVATAGKNRA